MVSYHGQFPWFYEFAQFPWFFPLSKIVIWMFLLWLYDHSDYHYYYSDYMIIMIIWLLWLLLCIWLNDHYSHMIYPESSRDFTRRLAQNRRLAAAAPAMIPSMNSQKLGWSVLSLSRIPMINYLTYIYLYMHMYMYMSC